MAGLRDDVQRWNIEHVLNTGEPLHHDDIMIIMMMMMTMTTMMNNLKYSQQ
jgi:hypothetical protein